jgi:hypothetical protein
METLYLTTVALSHLWHRSGYATLREDRAVAKMFPVNGPIKETRSSAESKVYYAMRDALSDDFWVMHGVTWTQVDGDGHISDGETDFVVAHPELGIVLMEVKGGGIFHDGATEQWYSRDRHGEDHPIKDPFRQVIGSTHNLAAYLKRQNPETRRWAREYQIAHCVWFPDIDWQPGQVRMPHIDDQLVLDRRNLSMVADGIARVARRFAGFDRKFRLSPHALEALVRAISPTFHLASPLALQMEEDERQFAELNSEQLQLLDSLRRRRRIKFEGAAGTGKTVLALELASRLSRQGLDVLFLCPNHMLIRWIRRRLEGLDSTSLSQLRVHHFDSLTEECETRSASGRDLASKTSAGTPNSLPKVIATMRRNGHPAPYDALIVDEAQDVDDQLWKALPLLLREGFKGILYAFYDPAQRDATGVWQPPIPGDVTVLPLLQNVRNTKQIHHFASQFYTGAEPTLCNGPEGRPVEFLEVPSRTPAGIEPEPLLLEQTLDRLVKEEHVEPKDIMVLSCRDGDSRWRDPKYQHMGSHELTWHADRESRDTVAVSTIRLAKGLERKVVILTELDSLEGNPQAQRLLYVALTRARHHLVIFGSREHIKQLASPRGAA